jgi:hypothetical protein
MRFLLSQEMIDLILPVIEKVLLIFLFSDTEHAEAILHEIGFDDEQIAGWQKYVVQQNGF